MNCKKCGQVINSEDKFCQSCGTSINEQEGTQKDFSITNQEVKSEFKKLAVKESKKMFIIGTTAGLIMVGIAFLIMYLGDNRVLKATDSDSFILKYTPLILIFTIFLVVGILLLAVRKNTKDNVEDKGRFITVINTNLNDLSLLDSKMQFALSNLGYKLVEYKSERVYFNKMFGNTIIGMSTFPRYIKYQVKENKVEIEAWVLIYGQEFKLSGYLGYLIKEKLRSDLENIMNYIQN